MWSMFKVDDKDTKMMSMTWLVTLNTFRIWRWCFHFWLQIIKCVWDFYVHLAQGIESWILISSSKRKIGLEELIFSCWPELCYEELFISHYQLRFSLCIPLHLDWEFTWRDRVTREGRYISRGFEWRWETQVVRGYCVDWWSKGMQPSFQHAVRGTTC